jgi:hypothetical protein
MKRQIKSEKITDSMREQLYNAYREKHQKYEEEKRLYKIITKSVEEAFLKEFFDNEKEIELFHKYKNAFSLTYFRIPVTDFGIDLKSLDIEKRLRRNSNYYIHINNIPAVTEDEWRDISKKINQILDNQGIRESITNLIKDYIRIVQYNETISDKFLVNFPQNYHRRECEFFCTDCTTTLQLKNKYPEIYELYLKTVPFLVNKEDLIKELRDRLGFINKN